MAGCTYSVSNPHGFPHVMERAADGLVRELTTRVGGARMAASATELVFDQVEYVRSVAVQSDLFAVAPNTGAVRRLTREARAGDPDLSPDGRTVVCTIQAGDRRSLAKLASGSNQGSPTMLVSEPDTHYATPRWSPDGRTIAAERRRVAGASEIVLLDADTGALVRVLASSVRGRNVSPTWLPGGAALLFTSDRAGGAFQIYRVDSDGRNLRRLVNAGSSTESPVLSPDGSVLVFVGYTADGYDLFSLPWEQAEWTSEEDSSPVKVDSAAVSAGGKPEAAAQPLDATAAAAAQTDSAYTPWRELLPRYWTPIIESDGDDPAFGAATAGADPLGRHAYAAGAAWSTRGRPDWYAAYAYDRWRPTVFANISDDTDPWFEGLVRTRELNGGVSLPFRTFRHTQSLFAAGHGSSDQFDCADCATPVDRTITRRALRGGWSYTSARQFGYSISQEEGFSAAASGEWSPRSLGSTGDSSALVLDLRGYVPAIPRHGVVAMRAAAAVAWGDDAARREFSAGGSDPASGGASFDRDAVALIRGFEPEDAVGTRVVVVNADYRFPLAWIERGYGTWPVFLRSLHGAIFADGGTAWDTRSGERHRRGSVGAEISADVVAGFALPFTVASGFAWRHDPTGAASGAAWFARVGHAF